MHSLFFFKEPSDVWLSFLSGCLPVCFCFFSPSFHEPLLHEYPDIYIMYCPISGYSKVMTFFGAVIDTLLFTVPNQKDGFGHHGCYCFAFWLLFDLFCVVLAFVLCYLYGVFSHGTL